jgi:hypothetical protein
MVKYMRCSPCIPIRQAYQKRRRPTVVPMALKNAQRTAVVRIPQFLSRQEVEAVLEATNGSKLPAYTSNYGEDIDDSGSPVHTTTYLQSRRFFYKRLRWLFKRIRRAAVKQCDKNNWGFSHRNSFFNVRVAEFHDMRIGGSLPFAEHYDVGSLVTVDILLEKAKAGAQFQTLECCTGQDTTLGELKNHEFEVGDALVFVSHKYHSVTPLTEGKRKVLVVEFWHGNRRRCGHRCDKPFGICTFRDS